MYFRIAKKRIVMSVSRRKFLKAGGSTMLLPFLHSVSEARAAAPKKGEKPDKKLVIMYIPTGLCAGSFFRVKIRRQYRDSSAALTRIRQKSSGGSRTTGYL